MVFEPGSYLGPYLLQAQIGVGGMGVVYRALDAKLDRQVAIKVLPASMAEDPARVARFQREARAVAALSHPNVLGIFDFGQVGNTVYAVMELLEGENLRERLRGGALPTRKALDLAAQVALGLAAAHGKGILHRDIKPENVFLCKDGQVKLLDFGLAKVLPRWNPVHATPDEQLTAMEATSTALVPIPFPGPGAMPGSGTQAGFVVGTLGYMSPEQIRGEELDARSDIFSFGVMLYELLSGQRAFRRDTAALTLEAILNEEAPELRSTKGALSPVLESIVAHCLEKRPEARFQSARDIAFALQHLDTTTLGGPMVPARPSPWRLSWRQGLGAVLALGVVLALGALGFRQAPVPVFHKVNASQGTLESAFFGPDGRTIFYSARIQGRKPELFVLLPDSEGPKPLGVQDALLLGVSATSELALLKNPARRFGGAYSGLLAQTPGGGGSVKEILEDVCDAAWDGRTMALLAMDDQGTLRVEFPSGHTVLQEQGSACVIKCLRLGGDKLALIRSDNNAGRSFVETVGRTGVRKTLFTKEGDSLAQTLTGLAWGPGGELWFSEWEGDQTSLWILPRHGGRRLVWRGEGAKQLLDVSAAGQVLLASQLVRRGVFLQKDGVTRELSILGGTQAAGLSADGRTLLLLESPALDGGTAQDQTYVYRPDQDAPMKLARGNPMSLTPDGSALHLSLDFMGPKDLEGGASAALQQAGLDPATILDPKADPIPYLYFMPTGPGRPRAVPLPRRFEGRGTAFLRGAQVLFQGQVKGELAWYDWTPGQGEPRAFTPPGLGGVVAGLIPLSPDGNRFVATGNAKDWFIILLHGSLPPQTVHGLRKGERIVGWCADNHNLYVRPELSVLPVDLWRLDPATGARTQVRSFTPPDPSGHLQIRTVFLTPDLSTVAYTYDRKLSELFRVEGLK